MTEKQLQRIERELERRGYRKWTSGLTSQESWGWFKTFDREENEHGELVGGYQVEFRVWDFREYAKEGVEAFGVDVWASPVGERGVFRMEVNWEPVESVAEHEELAGVVCRVARRWGVPN